MWLSLDVKLVTCHATLYCCWAQDSEEYRALSRSYEITLQQLEAERREVERLNRSIEALRVESINTRKETERATREVLYTA